MRVAGRATDADQPATALTVQISIDGVLKRTLTANLPDPPVATQGMAKAVLPPALPATASTPRSPRPRGASQVCVTAVNVGATGTNRTVCKSIDRVVEFSANSISYDTANAQIVGQRRDARPGHQHQQHQRAAEHDGQRGEVGRPRARLEADAGRQGHGLGKVGIPFGSSQITVEGSLSFEQNGSHHDRQFAWQQPVLVRPSRRWSRPSRITKTTLNVPYSLDGDYVYASGLPRPGTTAACSPASTATTSTSG